MAISFNENSAFNLKPIDIETEVRPDVRRLLLPNEQICLAFKTCRDQMIFTNKRIISVDVQGLLGKRVSYSTLPYRTIQLYAIQTPGPIEILPDTELCITFANGTVAKFEFKGNVDISIIDRAISENLLNNR